tara:strand:- start:85539 stop:86360 length:822 start_codon:yes stop_codon:yes gene_type:complete
VQFNKFLVVFDPTTDSQPALDRAAMIAGNNADSAHVHVFSCIYADLGKSGDSDARVKELVHAQQEILDAAIAPLVAQGLKVTTEIEWQKDWYQAVVQASKSNAADVVLKSTYKHSATQRLLKKSSDFTLIRECHCAVLLVKAGNSYEARKVLAAIDSRGSEDSYAKLNGNILEFCKRFTDSAGTEVHFVSAHKDLASRPDRGSMVRACGVPTERVHITMGDADDVIVDTARELGVNLVVVGNSARSGLSAVVNSNTAEKIVDDLDCDLFAMQG